MKACLAPIIEQSNGSCQLSLKSANVPTSITITIIGMCSLVFQSHRLCCSRWLETGQLVGISRAVEQQSVFLSYDY